MTRATDKNKAFIELLQKLDELGEPECASIPDIFFPEDITDQYQKVMSIRLAKSICADCPIKTACAEYAMTAREQYGVWGGLTATDRGH